MLLQYLENECKDIALLNNIVILFIVIYFS